MRVSRRVQFRTIWRSFSEGQPESAPCTNCSTAWGKDTRRRLKDCAHEKWNKGSHVFLCLCWMFSFSASSVTFNLYKHWRVGTTNSCIPSSLSASRTDQSQQWTHCEYIYSSRVLWAACTLLEYFTCYATPYFCSSAFQRQILKFLLPFFIWGLVVL